MSGMVDEGRWLPGSMTPEYRTPDGAVVDPTPQPDQYSAGYRDGKVDGLADLLTVLDADSARGVLVPALVVARIRTALDRARCAR